MFPSRALGYVLNLETKLTWLPNIYLFFSEHTLTLHSKHAILRKYKQEKEKHLSPALAILDTFIFYMFLIAEGLFHFSSSMFLPLTLPYTYPQIPNMSTDSQVDTLLFSV